jgi:hypothetical protein
VGVAKHLVGETAVIDENDDVRMERMARVRVTETANNDTVNGTAATFSAGDSLTGGAGTDVLVLVGQQHLPYGPARDLH